MVKIDITEKAKADIRETLEYIKLNLESPKASSDLADEIVNQLGLLKENPYGGPKVPDRFLSSYGFRFKSVKNYTAYYLVSENGEDTIIHIVRFLYSRRDYESILSNETE